MVFFEHQNLVMLFKSLFLNSNSVENKINIHQALFFLKKVRPKKKKKKNHQHSLFDNRARLLTILDFSQYGLACKYGIIFQISIHNRRQNYIF